MDHVRDHGKMLDEWNAWQRVVAEFDGLGIDMNEDRCERVVRAIALWAEVLVTLRMGQGIRERNAALKDKVERWNLAVAKT
jgi:hypothetical protein